MQNTTLTRPTVVHAFWHWYSCSNGYDTLRSIRLAGGFLEPWLHPSLFSCWFEASAAGSCRRLADRVRRQTGSSGVVLAGVAAFLSTRRGMLPHDGPSRLVRSELELQEVGRARSRQRRTIPGVFDALWRLQDVVAEARGVTRALLERVF